MWFTRVSLRNPVFATMVMLAFVVLGLFSLQRLQIDQFPNVDFPVVVVSTEYPGAAPEIVESEVTRKIEEGVNGIAGINTLTSRSYENQSVVVIEFQLQVDGRKAAEDVREKIAALRASLRDEVEEPRVQRFDPASRPIWSVAIMPDPSQGRAPDAVELTHWAEQVFKKRLEHARGVGAVTLAGASRRTVQVELQPAALEAFGVTPEQVVNTLQQENQDLPVGALRTLELERMVQIEARAARPQELERLIVARHNGQPVRLGQVARVLDGAQEVDSLALYNGQRTLLLQVQKAQDENTLAVIDSLTQVLAEIGPEVPAGIQLAPIGDTGRPIRVAVDNVTRTLIEGALLTVLIVFLFLNSWRSTVITGLTLPIALIGAFLFMHLFGFTINMITMMALSLCVGLLIDDAIVVRENIVRHVQMGKTPFQAALDGTQEIGLAVLATTLSIVAVFLPIGFMQGIVGKFFHEFGITIVAAVLISMFVSFTLDPMLSSVWHDPEIEPHDRLRPRRTLYDRTLGRLTQAIDQAQERLVEAYQGLLAWSLGHKKSTLAIAASTLVAAFALLPLLGSEFVPKADFSETSIAFETPVGSSLESTETKAREVEAIVRSLPEVRYTLTTINSGNAQGKTRASLYVRLVERDQRSRSVDELSALLRERLRQVGGITVTQAGLLDPVGGQKQIEFSLQGPDLQQLDRLGQQALARIRTIPGLVDLDSSAKPNKPTVSVTLKRDDATDLGIGTAHLAASLRTLVAGQSAGNWRAPDDETYDIQVRLPLAGRSTLEQLRALPLVIGSNADGSARVVRLSQVAEVSESTGASQINRRALTREVTITGNAYARSIGEISADIRRELDALQLPSGYRYSFGGSTKNMDESIGYAASALALAIIFIYMILASQFKSFLQPLALMSSLPLTLIGVVLALLLFGSSLSMFSVIGIVMLMGLVTKNAILLIDFAIRAREGTPDHPAMGREAALLLAGRVRLRPILMTTLAMVFGMVPLALAISEGSEQRAPMGQAVIGGVLTSTLLTLVVVPVVYCYMDDLGRWFQRLWSGRSHEDDSSATGS